MYTPIRNISIQNKDYVAGENYETIPETFDCWFRKVEAKKKSKGTSKK
jgi:hypothetical protein